MKPHWTELLPIDRFSVRVETPLGEREYKSLTLLYQPLIGATAVSLYLSLLNKVEKDAYASREGTHHELMVMLHTNLQEIYQARRILEGIGLLRTFERKEDTSTLFIYQLQLPLSPADFFQDDVLSVFLYNKLGRNQYLELRNRFLIESIDLEQFHEVTASFNDVFTSLHPSEMRQLHGITDVQGEWAYERREATIHFDEETFDFSLLLAALPEFIDEKAVKEKKVKNSILRLAFVYQISPLEMSRLIQQSYTENDQIDTEELKRRAQDWYRFEIGNEPPALGLRTQPKELRTMDGKKPTTSEEEMMIYFERTSPLTFLESVSNGAQAPPSDIKLAEALLFDYQLPPGVVNVLLDYVLQTNNMKLASNLVHKIAGHWSRKKIQTVQEAMELAKEEYRKRKKYDEQKQNNSQKTVSFRQQAPYVRKDKLPKWLEEENKKETSSMEEDTDLQKERQQFEELLRRRKARMQ